MQRIILYVLLLVSTATANPGFARQLSAIPGAFADVGIGAKVAGSGFAGTATLEGAGALNWNVASIYPAQGPESSFSFVDQLGIVDYGHASIAVPLWSNRAAIALSAQYSGDETLTEESAHIGYAHRISFLWIGVGVGYRRASFGKNTISAGDYVIFDDEEVAEGVSNQISGQATGYSMDAGLRMRLSSAVSVGFSVRNITAPITWESQSISRPETHSYIESIPMEFSVGVLYRLSDHISGALDWAPTLGQDSISRVGFGVEFSPVHEISLRTGRLVLQDGYRNEVSTFGFGVRTPRSFGLRLQADYAYVSSSIAHTQQVTLMIGL
jgi:hypothetical protein